MRKRLFNEYEATNDEGMKLDHKILLAIAPIIDEYIDNGYSFRDIESVCHNAVIGEVAYRALKWQVEQRKLEREKKQNG